MRETMHGYDANQRMESLKGLINKLDVKRFSKKYQPDYLLEDYPDSTLLPYKDNLNKLPEFFQCPSANFYNSYFSGILSGASLPKLLKLNGQDKRRKKIALKKERHSKSYYSLSKEKFGDKLNERDKDGYVSQERGKSPQMKSLNFITSKKEAMKILEDPAVQLKAPWHQILHYNIKRPDMTIANLPEVISSEKQKSEEPKKRVNQTFRKSFDLFNTGSESFSTPFSGRSVDQNQSLQEKFSDYLNSIGDKKIAKIARQKCMKILSPKKSTKGPRKSLKKSSNHPDTETSYGLIPHPIREPRFRVTNQPK